MKFIEFIKTTWQHRKEIQKTCAEAGRSVLNDPLGLGGKDPDAQLFSTLLFVLMVAMVFSAFVAD